MILKTRQEQKIRKENEKKRKLEKQKMLSERWAMLRWITTYIKENQEEWDKEKKEKEDLERKELDEWNKMKRFEKVKKLQEKWKIKSKNQETPVPEQDDNKPPADIWRELPFPLETVNCESVPVPVPEQENLSIPATHKREQEFQPVTGIYSSEDNSKSSAGKSTKLWSEWRITKNEDNLSVEDNSIVQELTTNEQQETTMKYDITNIIRKPRITRQDQIQKPTKKSSIISAHLQIPKKKSKPTVTTLVENKKKTPVKITMHTTKNEQHKNKETTTNNKQQKNPQLLQQQCSNITEATKSNDNEDNKIHSKETTTTNKNGQNKQQTQLVVLKPPSITCSPLVRTTRKKKEIITDNRTPKISKYFSAMPKPTVDSSIKHQNDTIEDVAEVNDASTEPEQSTNVQSFSSIFSAENSITVI